MDRVNNLRKSHLKITRPRKIKVSGFVGSLPFRAFRPHDFERPFFSPVSFGVNAHDGLSERETSRRVHSTAYINQLDEAINQ